MKDCVVFIYDYLWKCFFWDLGYFKDVEVCEKEDEVLKEWIKLVLDIVYDVEDVLDCYNLKVV